MQFDVGAELRRVRESRKLSLRAVASAVGVSASLLSQVETGKTQPSVSTLYALVNYLGISLDGLMGHNQVDNSPFGLSMSIEATSSDDRRSDSVVQRREDNPVIEMENGVAWERLAVGSSAVAVPVVVTYAPGGSSSVEGKMMRHAALEYGVLLEGRLTLKIEFDTYLLTPGDSFCFDAQRPHLYLNEGEDQARGIWFVIGNRHGSSWASPESDYFENEPIESAVDALRVMGRFKVDPGA